MTDKDDRAADHKATPPADRTVELSEEFRKGTDVFPIANVTPAAATPLLSADPPAGSDGPPPDGDGE